MYTANIAYTAPVNADDVTPRLTQDQVWAGLLRKVRHAQEFVPIIVACEVLSETHNDKGELVVTRTATLLDENDREKVAKEVCVHFAPSRVDFNQEDGTVVSNIISKGPDGELLMTYSFQWRYPNMTEGSQEAQNIEERLWKNSKMAVHGSINTIREMVKKGTIA